MFELYFRNNFLRSQYYPKGILIQSFCFVLWVFVVVAV